MTWNYRVMKRRMVDEVIFTIHEVYYNEDGTVTGYSSMGVSPIGETFEEFKNSLEMYNKSVSFPILDYDDLERKFHK